MNSMFARELDFKLEETENSYAACRALSLRARQVNYQAREQAQSETTESVAGPAVVALSDYASGRIVLTNEEESS